MYNKFRENKILNWYLNFEECTYKLPYYHTYIYIYNLKLIIIKN